MSISVLITKWDQRWCWEAIRGKGEVTSKASFSNEKCSSGMHAFKEVVRSELGDSRGTDKSVEVTNQNWFSLLISLLFSFLWLDLWMKRRKRDECKQTQNRKHDFFSVGISAPKHCRTVVLNCLNSLGAVAPKRWWMFSLRIFCVSGISNSFESSTRHFGFHPEFHIFSFHFNLPAEMFKMFTRNSLKSFNSFLSFGALKHCVWSGKGVQTPAARETPEKVAQWLVLMKECGGYEKNEQFTRRLRVIVVQKMWMNRKEAERKDEKK